VENCCYGTQEPLERDGSPAREFAFWLRDLRHRSGLTYEQLARSAHYATSTMQAATTGQRLPTLKAPTAGGGAPPVRPAAAHFRRAAHEQPLRARTATPERPLRTAHPDWRPQAARAGLGGASGPAAGHLPRRADGRAARPGSVRRYQRQLHRLAGGPRLRGLLAGTRPDFARIVTSLVAGPWPLLRAWNLTCAKNRQRRPDPREAGRRVQAAAPGADQRKAQRAQRRREPRVLALASANVECTAWVMAVGRTS